MQCFLRIGSSAEPAINLSVMPSKAHTEKFPRVIFWIISDRDSLDIDLCRLIRLWPPQAIMLSQLSLVTRVSFYSITVTSQWTPAVTSRRYRECSLIRLFSLTSKHQNIANQSTKAPCYWSLWGESTVSRWPVCSPHKGPGTRKCFHLMTPSWARRSCNNPKVNLICLPLPRCTEHV